MPQSTAIKPPLAVFRLAKEPSYNGNEEHRDLESAV